MASCRIERRLAIPVATAYDLIADIESYPRFVPFWLSATILERTARRMTVRQAVSIMGLRMDFVSAATLDPPHRIAIRSASPPFRDFALSWSLREMRPAATLIRAELAVEFDSRPLDAMASRLVPVLLWRVVAAFEREARGRAAHPARR